MITFYRKCENLIFTQFSTEYLRTDRIIKRPQNASSLNQKKKPEQNKKIKCAAEP